MKVLVITASFPPMPSGGADYAFRLCQHLADRNMDVCVLTTQRDDLIADARVKIHPIMHNWSWSELPRLLSLVSQLKPDIINLHFAGFLYNNHPMISYLPMLVKWKLPKVRIVSFIEAPAPLKAYLQSLPVRAAHKLLVKSSGRRIDYSYGSLLAESDSLILLSALHRDFLASNNKSVIDKMCVIPPPPLMQISQNADAVTKARTRESLAVARDDFLVAYLGYIYPGKGLETLLRSFQLLAQKRSHVRLLIIGGSPQPLLKDMAAEDYPNEIRRLSSELGLADKVIWSGGYSIDSAEPSLYLRASDICVLPFDNGVRLNNSSFASACAHGMPIVTTSDENLETPLSGDDIAVMCPPKDHTAMSEAMLKLYDSPELRQTYGRNSLALANRLFTWDITVERTLQVFRGERPSDLI